MSSGSGLGSTRTTLCYGIKSEGAPLGLGLGNSLSGFLTAPSLGQRNAALQLCLENTHTHRAESARLGFCNWCSNFCNLQNCKTLGRAVEQRNHHWHWVRAEPAGTQHPTDPGQAGRDSTSYLNFQLRFRQSCERKLSGSSAAKLPEAFCAEGLREISALLKDRAFRVWLLLRKKAKVRKELQEVTEQFSFFSDL